MLEILLPADRNIAIRFCLLWVQKKGKGQRARDQRITVGQKRYGFMGIRAVGSASLFCRYDIEQAVLAGYLGILAAHLVTVGRKVSP